MIAVMTLDGRYHGHGQDESEAHGIALKLGPDKRDSVRFLDDAGWEKVKQAGDNFNNRGAVVASVGTPIS